jgi:CspA family cold shock protein
VFGALRPWLFLHACWAPVRTAALFHRAHFRLCLFLLCSVPRFSKEKGFGFITRQDGTDVFIHFSNVRGGGFRVLEEGQSVDFTVAPGKKGQEARDVVARS